MTTASAVSKIDIEWLSGDIVVKVSESATSVTFTEMAGTSKSSLLLHSRVNAGELDIKFAASGASVPSDFSKSLTVTLPASLQLSELDVETVKGKITVEGVRAGEINVEGIAENITLRGCTFGEADVKTVSGDVELYLGDDGFRCEFESSGGSIFDSFNASMNGNVYTYDGGGRDISVETTSGNLWLKRIGE